MNILPELQSARVAHQKKTTYKICDRVMGLIEKGKMLDERKSKIFDHKKRMGTTSQFDCELNESQVRAFFGLKKLAKHQEAV